LVGLPKEIVMAVTAPTRNSTSHARLFPAALIAVLLLLLAGSLAAGQAHASTTCTLYATQGGSDNAPGTLAQPFASVQRLANALTAGQTGCVRGGTYTQDVTITHTGSASAPITITSYPGERATLNGRLWVHQGADYVTVSNMNLNGRNTSELPSPDINAAHTTFTGNDVTNENTAICFDIGSDTTYGRATNTIIQGNRIHQCGKLPAANHDHGIYVESSTATTIVENVIYDNADRGIQLYPDAQQTTIERNIIDSNGEGIIFSGDFGLASSNNTIANNLITNATLRYDIESWYPEGNPTGQNNTVLHNCVWGGAKGTIQTLQTGFTATNNTTTNPEYANPTTGDYRINSTSPCATLLTNTHTPTQPFTTTNTITYPGTTSTTTSTKKHHRAVAAQARHLKRAHSARKHHRHSTKGAKHRRHRHAKHGRHTAGHHGGVNRHAKRA
jgi:parallel beta-helix repeat protein